MLSYTKIKILVQKKHYIWISQDTEVQDKLLVQLLKA